MVHIDSPSSHFPYFKKSRRMPFFPTFKSCNLEWNLYFSLENKLELPVCEQIFKTDDMI